jgi:hypothetical protein
MVEHMHSLLSIYRELETLLVLVFFIGVLTGYLVVWAITEIERVKRSRIDAMEVRLKQIEAIIEPQRMFENPLDDFVEFAKRGIDE